MRLWIALLAVVPACGFQSVSPGGDGGPIDGDDAPIPIDAPEPLCFGSYIKICFADPSKVPTAPPTLPSSALIDVDTDTSDLCDENHDRQEEFCVIVGGGFNIPNGTKLRAYGTRPLVLLSPGAIAVLGMLDVSSTAATGVASNSKGRGAGATGSDCVFGTPPSAPMGHSGGYGGTFGGKGGFGQQLGGGGEMRGEPGTPSSFPATLRGGCPGGPGANAGDLSGQGGLGGGAVAVIAAHITISGVINASGAGGAGGPQLLKAGAGGGGSGGMIFLESQTIVHVAPGRLFANGGGGGEGGSPDDAGQPGQTSLGPMEPAAGGITSNEGGNGGPGSAAVALDGGTSPGQSSGDGGGGAGGGAAGFIHAPGISGIENIAPPSTEPSTSQ